MAKEAAVSVETLTRRIHLIRGHKVMLDADLAALYGVPTKAFNQAIKRKRNRFPRDFLFRLTQTEAQALRSQAVTANRGRGGRRNTPLAFTEHGAIMAATILNSPRAVQMSVFVVRAFVQIRHSVATHTALKEKLGELERRVSSHDEAIAGILAAIRQLMREPETHRRGIGFTADV